MLSFLVLLLKFASFTSANTECGIKGSTHPLWRIVGGNDTKPLEYPWMAFYGCGGSIINDQWIITAGHCAGPQFKSEILFGAYDINKYGKNFSLESTAIMIESLHAYRHPKYELDENVPGGGRPKYDMSLIKLKHKLDLNGKDKHLRPICLPTNTTTVKDLMSTECVVTGWGNTESSG